MGIPVEFFGVATPDILFALSGVVLLYSTAVLLPATCVTAVTIEAEPSRAVAILQAAGRKATMARLLNTSNRSSLTEVACARLARLSVADGGVHKAAIVSAGGIEALVEGLHGGSADVQEKLAVVSCRALRSLASLGSGEADSDELTSRRAAIASAGGVAAIIHAMGAHSWSAGAQEQGCGALCSLASSSGEALPIILGGGIEAVVKAMGGHCGSAGVQRQGCDALRRLAATSEPNSVAVAAARGIEAVVMAMERHSESAGVQKAGCHALRSLARGSERKQAISCARGIEAVVTAMEGHGGSAGVQQHGCGALRNLAGSEPNKQAIASARGIEAVVTAMEGHSESAAVQQQGCGALRNLAAGSEPNKQAIRQAGGLQAITHARETFAGAVAGTSSLPSATGNEEVVKQADAALRALGSAVAQ